MSVKNCNLFQASCMNEFFEEGAKFYALIHFVCDEKKARKFQ